MPAKKAAPAGRTQTREPARGRYANTSEVDTTDESLLGSPGGRDATRDPEDIRPNTPEEDGAPQQDVRGRPAGERTRRVGPGNGEETMDGLDETEESVRRQAEDRPLRPRGG